MGAAAVVTGGGAQTYHWQAFDVRASVQMAPHGQTRLIFTPLGEVRAATHRTPIVLNLSLQSIALDKIKTLAAHPPPRKALEKDFARAARRDLWDFCRRQIWLGALGGMLGPMVLRRRRLRVWLSGAAVGGLFIALLLGATARTWNSRAFDTPTYTGSLQGAGALIALARDTVSRAQALSDKLRVVATNLNSLYGRINAVPGLAPAPADCIRLLHISDIHNNAAALDFVQELAKNAQVDAVVDTGDLSDFGTPVETRLTRGLARLGVPYVFVAGNHDSQATVRAVRALPNARVLDGAPVSVAGLSLLGLPDPSSARASLGSVDTPPDALRELGDRLHAAFVAAASPPDIVCVHNPRAAEPLIGLAPVILCGHLHRASLETPPGTTVCNAGTTGGAGLRYFDRTEGVPLTAVLLTFRRAPRPRLLFADQVVLDGSLSQYSITRRTFPAAP